MSLAKRLEEAVREGRFTAVQADAVLNRRAERWNGELPGGQMLLVFPPARKDGTRDK